MAASRIAAPTAEPSMKRALTFVYVGYAFRYLYLLILVPLYGRVLGAAEYGRVLAAMSLYQMVWMLAEYGFTANGIRDIALDNDPRRIAALYGRHMSGRLMAAIIGLVVGVGGTLLSPLLREQPLFGVLATLNGLVAACNMGWYFQGTLQFRTSVLIELCGFTLNLGIILLLVRGKNDGWLVLASLLASSVVATVIAHGVALRSMDRASIRWSGGVSLIRESTALFAHKGLTVLMSSSSTFLISLFADARQVGLYGAAERLATVGLSLLQPANQVLIGTVATLIASRATEKEAFALIRRGLLVLTALGGLMLAGTLGLAGIAVPILLGSEFRPSVSMLRVLGLMFPFAAFSQVVTGYVLVPLRYDRLVSVVSLFGAIVTVALSVGLGLPFGGMGVSWARVLGYVAMSLLLVEVVRRLRLGERILRPQ